MPSLQISTCLRNAKHALIAFCGGLALGPMPAWPDDGPLRPTPESVVQEIAQCLHDGKEVVMAANSKPRCVIRSTGQKIAKHEGMPFDVDASAVCKN